jgi:hypothetical protein
MKSSFTWQFWQTNLIAFFCFPCLSVPHICACGTSYRLYCYASQTSTSQGLPSVRKVRAVVVGKLINYEEWTYYFQQFLKIQLLK